ncbi:MAG: hypothetical protein ABIR30_04210 [Chitinophagaceae bacterium]
MKKLIPVILAIALLISCSNDKKEKTPADTPNVAIDSSLVTDSSWGAVTASTDFTGLQTIYGRSNVTDERICGPECVDSLDVTVIYTGTPKEIIVYWKDSAYHKSIGTLRAGGSGAPYHTSTGLKIGSTLQDLLKQNGQKINFSGFGWDYGGYIQSFNSGSLDKSPILFRLDLMEGDTNELLGDTELNTDMPAVKKVLDKIQVYQLSLSFNKE